MASIPNRPFPLTRIMIVLLSIAGVFLIAALVLPKSAKAQAIQKTITLNSDQKQQVQNIQAYLNAMPTLKSRFLQVTSLGQFSQGEFFMKRPGRMRINYDEPSPISIVSDGTWVLYKDKELDQLSYMLLSAMPASIFIGERVDFFGKDVLIAGFVNEARVARLTLKRNDDNAAGTLTLVFATKPLTLKQWSVVDAQNISTTVSLLAPQFGVPLDNALFKVESRTMKNKNR